MNPFLLLVVALAVTGTLGIFLGEIFVLIIAVALAVFWRSECGCDASGAAHRAVGPKIVR